MESCGAAWVGSSDWANHLQSQVQETMQRRKERFLSAAEDAWQETNTCKYSRFESIESQVVFCASISVLLKYYIVLWCVNMDRTCPLAGAFTSFKTKKKGQRENLRLTQNS